MHALVEKEENFESQVACSDLPIKSIMLPSYARTRPVYR